MKFLFFFKALVGRFAGTWIVLGSMWSFNLTHPENPSEEPESWRVTRVPLKDLAARHNLNVGTAVALRYLNDDTTYRQAVTREFNIISAENEMKFPSLHPHPATYTFDRADKIVDFAEENDLLVRGHTLIWFGKPKWIQDMRAEGTREDMLAIMENHITTVVGHFKGKVDYWDVVNEAISGYWGLRNRNIWNSVIGEDYIEQAFHFAHKADPDAKLMYNDFRVEGLNPKADRLYNLARKFKEQGVPIHGVGLQTHMHFSMPSKETMIKHFRRLEALGLEIHLTEIDLGFRQPITNEKLIKQAIRYQRLTEACLEVPACTTMVFWGMSDAHSWIPIFFKPYDAPLLFDTEMKPKLAYYSIANALINHAAPDTK